MSSGAEQDDLERMLAASRELRSRYRAAAQEEPSAHVDDAIRAHARRTVGARPRSAASRFGSSWRVPLSIAAVLVLSVTLTVMVTRQDKHLPSADQSSARETVRERAPEPAMTPAEAQPPNAAKPSANAKEDALGRREKARAMPAPEQQEAPEKDLYQTPAQPPSFDEGATSGLKKQAEPFPAAPPAPVPRAEPAPSSAPEPKAAAPATAGVPEQERDATANGDAALALRERALAEKRQDAPPKPLSSNADRPDGKLKSEELAGGLSARVAPQRRQAPAAAVEQPQAGTASAPTPAPAPWESDPQAWLRHIETLVREKRMTEARDGFKAFRQRYPAYPLPAEFPLREP